MPATSTKSLESIRKELMDRIENLQSMICGGQPRSLEEYKGMVGQLQGFKVAYEMTLPREEPKEKVA